MHRCSGSVRLYNLFPRPHHFVDSVPFSLAYFQWYLALQESMIPRLLLGSGYEQSLGAPETSEFISDFAV
jgi:hypothetical protein